MELNIINSERTIPVSAAVFDREYCEGLVHQVVVAYRNSGRMGTKAQLSRSAVSGTTKKFKKQKGGGARHGDYRAPIFIGGGVTFAAKPRSFEQKVNRKTFRAALKVIISQMNRESRLKIVDSFVLEAPRTKLLREKLASLQADGKNVLLITESVETNLYLAARNYRAIHVIDALGLDPVSLVSTDYVIMTADSISKVQDWLV